MSFHLNVKNGKGDNLNINVISAPFREEKHEKLYETYKSTDCFY